MTVNPAIFKGYDIRGIYPTELNEENIVPIINAIYTFFEKSTAESPLRIVVGTDMRLSSPSLTRVAVDTLRGLGANVIDIGMVSSPTFYFAVNTYECEGGIQITASHNPKEYNGIKIVMKGQTGLIKIGKTTGLEEIKNLSMGNIPHAASPKPGTVEKKTQTVQEEVDNALEITGRPQINNFKIVADAANAMGGTYIEALFKKVPVRLIPMNFTLDGNFPAHQPDPLQKETLVDLQKRVTDEKADLGLAPDGDGDRLFFIDEKGNIVPPTIITSIIASDLLKKYPGEKFYIDIRYILTPKKIIEKMGGSVTITKVGHAFITEAMNKDGGIFAGESSAHYFFRETGNAESQLPVILTILKVMTQTKKPLSELVDLYRASYESGEINFKVQNASEIMEKIRKTYADSEIWDFDGISGNYPDWRFSVRTSNTEPLLRLNVEAFDEKTTRQKTQEIKDIIQKMSK